MPATPKMQIAIAPPPTGWNGNTAELFELLSANIEITIPDGFLRGGIGSVLPTSNIGPFLKDEKEWYVWDEGTAVYVPIDAFVNVGQIYYFAYSDIDTNKYKACDGSAVPRTDPFSLLYSRVGQKYGDGDGSTTFNLPDLRGRVLIGAGKGSVPGESGGPASALTVRNLGDLIGEETHALIKAELPLASNATAGAAAGGVATDATVKGTAHNNIQPSSVAVACIRYA